jgi:hypothetical protein
MTRIVNIRSGEPYDVYIGRPGKGQEGYFGNPHPIGFCEICDCRHGRELAISAYKVYFMFRLESDPEFKRRVLELKDKVLGCFCKPAACHGDIIAEYLDKNV